MVECSQAHALTHYFVNRRLAVQQNIIIVCIWYCIFFSILNGIVTGLSLQVLYFYLLTNLIDPLLNLIYLVYLITRKLGVIRHNFAILEGNHELPMLSTLKLLVIGTH